MGIRSAVCGLVLAGVCGGVWAQAPATSVMTYQGELTDGGLPANGPHDFRVNVFDVPVGGAPLSFSNCWDGLDVVDGRFVLTFHPGSVFDGRALYLQIEVRADSTAANCGTGAYAVLGPRQAMTAAPLASALVLPTRQTVPVAGPTLSITNGSNSASAVAIEAVSGATTANSVALVGANTSTGSGAVGVWGRISTATPGAGAVGVLGTVSGASSGVGVYGTHAGTGIAVRGTSNGGTGVSGDGSVGVSGLGSGGVSPVGVRGSVFNAEGTGVEGNHSHAAGSAPGVKGTTISTDANAAGVFGVSVSGTAGSSSAGVLGVNQGTGSNGAGVRGYHFGSGVGVYGSGQSGVGVKGEMLEASGDSMAVFGLNSSTSSAAIGVAGTISAVTPGGSASGVFGTVVSGTATTGVGVQGTHLGLGVGVRGDSVGGVAVQGQGQTVGVQGYVTTSGAAGTVGVYGSNSNASGTGVKGEHLATTGTTAGVWGLTGSTNANAVGVLGEVSSLVPGAFSAGVRAVNHGTGGNGVGLYALHEGSGYGVYATTTGATGYAGYFSGRVFVSGNLQVGGTLSKAAGSFKIDHPLDPANKYLSHSFVESPDMMNIYNGTVTTDEKGYATVTLPDWFEALNQDFRYQLTVIDAADSDEFVLAKVVKEVQDNRFTVRSSAGGVKVSWQVTGVRHDAYARDRRVPTEEFKSESERGMFLYPQGFGFGDDRGIGRVAPRDLGLQGE